MLVKLAQEALSFEHVYHGASDWGSAHMGNGRVGKVLAAQIAVGRCVEAGCLQLGQGFLRLPLEELELPIRLPGRKSAVRLSTQFYIAIGQLSVIDVMQYVSQNAGAAIARPAVCCFLLTPFSIRRWGRRRG